MSTTHAADFRAALTGYNAALAAYQSAVNAIEDAGRTAQSDGRTALAYVNATALDSGSRATCVVRAAVEAQILKLDLDVNARTADPATIDATIQSLDARLRLLANARRDLDHAKAELDKVFDAIAATGTAAIEALTECAAAAKK